jgi:tRNA(adenine34) deaminase
MRRALSLAEKAREVGEVPVGAIVVRQGEMLGEGWNRPIGGCDPTAHAEIVAMREAATKLGNYRLTGSTLYVTIEPCTMCLGAMIHARLERLVFGATEPRAGAVQSQLQLLDHSHYNHRISWAGGVLADESSLLIQEFFQKKRR